MEALSSPPNVVKNSPALLLMSEKGILQLLVAARGSSLKTKDKTKLRDLILEYSALKDESEKTKLSKEINDMLSDHLKDFGALLGGYGEAPAPIAKAPAPQSFTRLGGIRPEPVFASVRDVEAVKRPEVRKLTVGQAEPNVKAEKVEAATPQEKENATESPIPRPASADASDKSPLASHVENPQARIDEIKRIVNSKFGNPINLIEANPTVGRAYMNALLNAMKKSNGGALAGEVDVAMEALEKAFTDVEKNLNAADTKHQKQQEQKEVPTASPIGSERQKPEARSAPVALEQKPEPQKEPTVPSVLPQAEHKEPFKKAASLADLRPVPKMEKKQSEGLYHLPEDDVSEEKPIKSAPAKRSLLGNLTSKLWSPDKKPDVPAPTAKGETRMPPSTDAEAEAKKPAPPAAKEPKENKLQSVAAEATLPEKMDTLKKTLAEKETASAKPITGLDSAEVSDGLSRLLSEWKLFKSSGFLGTGPSGKDHPLYKQLAGLPMAAVIAGRFEGFTPEIKQGITDYMNGWRYEHGILHEMGETFEHYLRRVILVILENQRLKKFEGASGTE